MAVTVTLFAALRDAAGTSQVEVAPATVPAIVADLRERFGEPFAARVAVASGLLDGRRVTLDDDIDVPDGAELALLPPFSGGANAPGPQRRAQQLLLAGSLLVPGVLVLGVFAPSWAFGLVITVIAAGTLVDLHTTLGATSVRPLLPATLVVGVGPVLVLAAAPATAAPWVSALLAVTVMATLLMAFMSPRRLHSAAMVGASLLAGLVVATGAIGLMLLDSLMDTPFVVAALVTIGVTDAAVTAVGRPLMQARTGRRVIAALVAATLAVTVAFTLDADTRPALLLVGVGAAAVVAALAGSRLRQVLSGGADGDAGAPALLVGTADGVLIGAPLVILCAAALTIG